MSTSIPVKKALAALLRDPGNSNCADCKSQSHPRWAAWSLGVFICIKCAGIHRSLGTHISKVKSVDLDTWKEEHLEVLIMMKNNKNANLYYECKLDPKIAESLKKDLLDTNKLQTFIRNKYDSKKWIGSSIEQVTKENVHDLLNESSVSDIDNIGKSVSDISLKGTVNNTQLNSRPVKPIQNTSNSGISLLNLEKVSSSISVNSTVNTSLDNSSASTQNKTTAMNQRPDLKKSILSLYSKSNTTVRSTSFNNNASNNNVMPNSSMNMMSGTSSASSSTASSVKFNNLAMNASKSVNNSTISLDDNDLFKNVWS